MGVKLFRTSLVICGMMIGAGINETVAQPVATGIAVIFILLAIYGICTPKSEGEMNTFKIKDKST